MFHKYNNDGPDGEVSLQCTTQTSTIYYLLLFYFIIIVLYYFILFYFTLPVIQ